MSSGYDVKCLDLAKAFLSDVALDELADRERLAGRLAQEIQDTIETFIEYDEEMVLNTRHAKGDRS